MRCSAQKQNRNFKLFANSIGTLKKKKNRQKKRGKKLVNTLQPIGMKAKNSLNLSCYGEKLLL